MLPFNTLVPTEAVVKIPRIHIVVNGGKDYLIWEFKKKLDTQLRQDT